jgi:anti-sigma regulatory factor (Ser/Thr protein kinase)
VSAHPPRVWVGRPPEGVEGFLTVARIDDVPEASLIALDPPPNLWAVSSWLSARKAPVVACFATAPDAFVTHAWHAAGAWCVVRDGATPRELAGIFDRIERQHGPNVEARVRHALSLQPRLSLTFRSIDDVEHVALVVSFALPDAQRRLAGIVELLVNAVEHGNLELSSAEKQALLERGQWRAEIERRLATSPWRERTVTVTLSTEAEGWRLSIEDQGSGFTQPPAAAVSSADLRGRGIAVARASFDSLQWEGNGNRVVARIFK